MKLLNTFTALCVLSHHGADGFTTPSSKASSLKLNSQSPRSSTETSSRTENVPPPGIAKPRGSRYAPQKYRYDPSQTAGPGPANTYRYDPFQSGPRGGPEGPGNRYEAQSGPQTGARGMSDRGYIPQQSQTRHLQGAGSREFWHASPDRTEVNLGSHRRSPVEAEVELWQGPNNTPQRVRTWSMDGWLRPFQAEFENSGKSGMPGTMQIRNTGVMEFPATATIQDADPARADDVLYIRSETVDGGALKTFQFDQKVESVRVNLHTDGLPLMAIVELWQGPSNVQQIAEVYVDDGRASPFTQVIETPGYEWSGCNGSIIAIRNAGPLAYPIKASLEPIFGDGSKRFAPDPYFEERKSNSRAPHMATRWYESDHSDPYCNVFMQ